MQNSMAGELYIIPSFDKFLQNVANIRINETLNHNQSKTVNIDIEDRPLNGQLGTIMQITADSNVNVTKIYVAFDDNKAGSRKMTKNIFGSIHWWAPIDIYIMLI